MSKWVDGLVKLIRLDGTSKPNSKVAYLWRAKGRLLFRFHAAFVFTFAYYVAYPYQDKIWDFYFRCWGKTNSIKEGKNESIYKSIDIH